MRRLIVLTLTLLSLCLAAPAGAYSSAPWAPNGPSRGEDLHVYLLTFGVGGAADIASWFGHTALMVRDDRLRQERVYNYGMFSFGPDMLPKFLMGRLEFWVGEASVRGTMELYKELDRDVLQSELNLSPRKRRAMAEFLAWNVMPENRNYLYHHYFDNCATRIRDAIDKQVDGQFAKAAADPSRTTLRGHTSRHTQRNPYIDVLLSGWMNDDIDQPITEWDDMFLPSELLLQVEALEYENEQGQMVKLVPKTEVIYKSSRPGPPYMPSSKWWWTGLLGTFLGFVGFAFARKYQQTGEAKWRRLLGTHHFFIGLLYGIPGLVAVLFNFTDHKLTWWNENMLLWSPLTFLALILSLPVMRGSMWALRTMRFCWGVMAITSIAAVVLQVLPMFDQQNGFMLTMLVPFNVLMAAGMWGFSKSAALPPMSDGSTAPSD